MCDVSRRRFLSDGAALMAIAANAEYLSGQDAKKSPVATKLDAVAPDVYFHEGQLSDTADAVCNNGWVLFEDYVLVIDANFPAGAREIIRKIRTVTNKPIRFAFDTHHHGDHAYGNRIFVENGAVPIAHTGVIDEMKRYETGYYGGEPGAWEQASKGRSDLKGTKLKPPSVLFPHELIFDDGKHRVELIHLGVAHTHGDAVAWLPSERILFAGDVCVNGPYNYAGDGDVSKWVGTLDAAKKLGARIVCPGHGSRASGSLLDDQQAFFKALREEVGARMTKAAPEKARAEIEHIRGALKGRPQIARFVGTAGTGWDPFPSQVEKVYLEMTGQKLAMLGEWAPDARLIHARAHGLAL